jgi:uncharacterized protein YdhG (YjbR/CyaY superfamily)
LPDDARLAIEQIRQAIRRAAPDAVETMSYGMPTFDRNGKHLVFVAGWKRHVSLYPTPQGDDVYQEAIAPFRAAKSSLHFPLSAPMPTRLVEQTVSLLIEARR